MTDTRSEPILPGERGWRIAGWSAAVALLMLPAIAMQFTEEVDWTPSDFVFAAILLGTLGLGVEIAIRVARTRLHFAGLVVAALTGFFTLWSNAAVGIIGAEGEPVNMGFNVLVLAALVATLAVRFRAAKLRWVMGAMAIGQFALGIAALLAMPGHAVEWGILAMFAALWGLSAFCFARATKA